MLVIVLSILYGGMILVATLNRTLMRKPTGASEVCFEVLIPARNEERVLPFLIPNLVSRGAKVTVFDDESEDQTAICASDLGAIVVENLESLPEGWTGKNNACHQLSLRSVSRWTVFLDADTQPSEEFVPRLSNFLNSLSAEVQVVSGFPRMLPGRGIEPLYLGWMPWILLVSNPFGLVTKSGLGHNRFTNGQFSAWRTSFLQEFRPFEKVKSEILEDVRIGRLLYQNGAKVEVVNMTECLSVKMYSTVSEAINGMSKNSCEIAGGTVPSLLLVAFLFFVAWGWAFCGLWALPLYCALVFGKVIVDSISRQPVWTAPFIPLTLTMAGLTIIRSMIWKRRKSIQWKGRTYS
jgi:cellulose synthase/poly-beta-1,6-N-acetylglucosamine synthase-like glycosyltransferase